MQVLIIKTSSMGDIIHTLPALTDAMSAIPNITFDWVVEPAFQEIPTWHNAVKNVIVVPLRAWRKSLFKQESLAEIKGFFTKLRAKKYDMVIDAQGLIKSSILAKLCNSDIYGGFSVKSAREALASLLYNKKIIVPLELHAIERTRQLFAGLLVYKLPTIVDYGVNWQKFPNKNFAKPYLFFLHGTTWNTKHWPEQYWQRLAEIAGLNGYDSYMTWATDDQRDRVERLSNKVTTIKMLPHLSITEAAQYLKGAVGVVAVDTGFCHLSAAIGKPTVALFGPTDPNKVGIFGARQLNLASTLECAPCLQRGCRHAADNITFPPCFAKITPEMVWDKLITVLDPLTDQSQN